MDTLSSKYFKNSNDDIFKIDIVLDNDPINPREDNESVYHMMCWNKRYSLGDRHNYNTPTDFFKAKIEENKAISRLIDFVKDGKTSNNLEINHNESSDKYELIAEYTLCGSREPHTQRGIVAEATSPEDLYEDIVDILPYSDFIKILEEIGFIFLPLSIYDHSGITMYIGSSSDHYDGQWDCSEVGWIYTTKTEIVDGLKISEDEWEKYADEGLRYDVKYYDLYLRGDVYGYQVYKLNKDDMSTHVYTLEDIKNNPTLESLFFEEYDACYGYATDDIDALLDETIHHDFSATEVYDTIYDIKEN